LKGDLPVGWDQDLPTFPVGKGQATRVSSGQVLNAIAAKVPQIMGGSADLNPSTNTALKGLGDFQNPSTPVNDKQGAVGGVWSYAGRNVPYGVREHAMGSISNGLALHGGIIPFTATFLQFADYMRPAIRLAALMEQRVIFVFTHDSIFLGEDGPTHQPVEHLAALRTIPNLTVIRPADANETAVAWQLAVERQHGPTALIFSRQTMPIFDRAVVASAEGVRKGGYVLIDTDGTPDIILMASGSEVALAAGARDELAKRGLRARVVSLPSWELFDAQPRDYRESVLPPFVRSRLAIEAGVAQGWHKYVGDHGKIMSIERFGASAPYQVLAEKFGFTVDAVVTISRQMRGDVTQKL
ncbi:MAG TPA: transketolase C-terminal domain-containing protein, partial [Anaerolineae bacterium]|nr:transketolase C-terminal domain-containing protein [Anaerolineae bacterium]